MKRRQFFGGVAGALVAGRAVAEDCACDDAPVLLAQNRGQRALANDPGRPAMGPAPSPWQTGQYDRVLSKVRITNVKTFGVSLTPESDRPYVFVKIETNAGVEGWGEATLEGKAGAAMACVNDFRDFLIGSDPMQVEHHWQSMYVHSFYRAGPVMGSAISGIDQALWDIRGKVLGMPVYKLLGGPVDPRGVRGYYHTQARTREDLVKLRETAIRDGVSCFKTGPAGRTFEWIETSEHIDAAIKSLQSIREAIGPNIDIAVDFHAKTSPSVAAIIVKEVEPLNLLFVEELCPPENIKAMARIAKRTTTPIATGERLVASYGCRELIELGVVDILQTDINHVGGITAVWKVGAMAAASGLSMAPHNCEGPIGGLATINVDAAMPNFVVQEVCSGVEPGPNEKAWAEWFGFPVMRMVNGRFPLSDKPGLGFELKEEAFSKYPFGGTKPMARVFHTDGSVAEW
jgi:galactonate dehydratase